MVLIDQWIGAYKHVSSLKVRVTYHRANIIKFKFTGPVLDFSITESVKSKAGLTGFDSLPAQCVLIRRFGLAQWTCTQFSIFEHLRMTQRDCLPGRSPHSDTQPAYKVLTKIKDGTPGWRCENCSRCD